MESLEEKYLEAIRALKSELHQLLEPEEAKRLNRRLGQYLRWARFPEHRERALTRALAAIREYPPQVRDRLAEILRREGVEERTRLFEPLPGPEPIPLPPGTLMVCPMDPGHYRRRLQFAGQRLRCPDHEVDLVPEQSIRG
jgi:hypothetical protein